MNPYLLGHTQAEIIADKRSLMQNHGFQRTTDRVRAYAQSMHNPLINNAQQPTNICAKYIPTGNGNDKWCSVHYCYCL